MAALAVAAQVVGTVVSAVGTLAAGAQAKNTAEFEAAQYRQKANEERAVASRTMQNERRQKELVISKLNANAAQASGDTTDTGVLNLVGGIEKEGEYQALSAFARGENAARGLEDQAYMTKRKGEFAQTASYMKAAGSVMEGISGIGSKKGNTLLDSAQSMYSRYS